MGRQSTRDTLVSALIFSGIFSLLNFWFTGKDVLAAVLTAPIFFAVMFFTMRATNRISGSILGRFRPHREQDAPALPPEASTDRPAHAQHRRQRRRRRGRGRRG